MVSPPIPVLAALLVGLAPSVWGRATLSATEDPLVGLWVAEATFGPALRGELTLTRDGSSWRATLAGAETTFPRDGDAVDYRRFIAHREISVQIWPR